MKDEIIDYLIKKYKMLSKNVTDETKADLYTIGSIIHKDLIVSLDDEIDEYIALKLSK